MTSDVLGGIAAILGALGLSEVVRRWLASSDRRYDRVHQLETRIDQLDQRIEEERHKRFVVENEAQSVQLKALRLTDEIQALKARMELTQRTVGRLEEHQEQVDSPAAGPSPGPEA